MEVCTQFDTLILTLIALIYKINFCIFKVKAKKKKKKKNAENMIDKQVNI
jgi:hypothetical protein